MFTRATVHPFVTIAAMSIALAGCTHPAGAAPSHDHDDTGYAITLNGSQAFPESVAADDHYVYATSIADGTVYRGSTGARTLEPFLRGGQDGRTSATGIKIAGDRLLVAGFLTGRFFI